jgi:heat shock transcription factor
MVHCYVFQCQGFHKIKHDQWEFANEYFLKDQYYLLGNIQGKQTVHNHALGEVERLAFEEEIEKLENEKASIELDISSFKQYLPAKKLHVDNLVQRLEALEYRLNNLKNSFETVLQNPKFVEKMNKKLSSFFR